MENQDSDKDKKRLIIPKEYLEELLKKFERLEEKNNKEFKDAMRTLKHIFKTKDLIKPKNWEEIFYEWYYEKYPDILSITHYEDLHTLIGDRKTILEWAEEYTNSISKQKVEDEQITKKGEFLAVRYMLMDHFFQGNEAFKSLKIKDQEKLLGYILGCHPDTAKDIKNNVGNKNPDGKYIKQEHRNRFSILSDKIKKGEIG